jgi:hypothetical protein
VIVANRPTELLLGPHPFHRVRQELQARGKCTDLAVRLLSRKEIEHYLELTFPGHGFPNDFADLIYARTEGSPLFMVDLLSDLRERGLVAESEGRWILAQALPDLREGLPASNLLVQITPAPAARRVFLVSPLSKLHRQRSWSAPLAPLNLHTLVGWTALPR